MAVIPASSQLIPTARKMLQCCHGNSQSVALGPLHTILTLCVVFVHTLGDMVTRQVEDGRGQGWVYLGLAPQA